MQSEANTACASELANLSQLSHGFDSATEATPLLRIAGIREDDDIVIIGRKTLDRLIALNRRNCRSVTQDDITVFPLAFPLIAGPGAMTSVILLMGRTSGNTAQALAVVAMLLVALTIVLASLLQAGLIVRVLKGSGCNVVARVMGINLAALAVQFIVDGLHDILIQWQMA